MSSIELVVKSRQRDIGGFMVNRVLPYVKRKMVGPFIFLDHMGPVDFLPGDGIDVKPHPHIGLATITYLFAGTITHRDSLGNIQDIYPGDVNWMTAGNGIVHSERTSQALRANDNQMHGIQIWIALPKEYEDVDPSFYHYPHTELPRWESNGIVFNLIVGQAFGQTSPVQTFSKMFYVDLISSQKGELKIEDELFGERAVYIVEGPIEIAGELFQRGNLIVLREKETISMQLGVNTHCLLIGGEPMAERRYIWWNFVSSSEEKIEQAKTRWKQQDFPPVPDETEFVPLPER